MAMHKFIGVAGFVLLGLLSSATQALPCAGFTDVDDTSPFCGNVTWLKNRSITLGCTSTTLYCPNDFVSRLQMAAFMNRLGDSLFPLTCAAGQVMKWDGLQWACANDAIGGGGGGGTVTSVAAGTGLQGSPNPITGAGAINLAPAYQLPQACSNGQVPKSNGAGGWACGADAAGAGTVASITAGTGLTGGTITSTGTIAADTGFLQRRVSQACAAGSSIRAIAADGTVSCETDDMGPANAFVQGGNTFGATAVLGTTDSQSIDIRVDGTRVMRYEAASPSHNVIGGHPGNASSAPFGVGQTVGGGGLEGSTCWDPAAGSYSRSCRNAALGNFATVGGGYGNQAGGTGSVVAGGVANATDETHTTIAGGRQNWANRTYAAVGGGDENTASAFGATVAGGQGNTASGAYGVASGGAGNVASGDFAAIPGGLFNLAEGYSSVALGRRAKAQADGAFAFADSSDFDFNVTTPNQFALRATGGARFVTAIDGAGNPTRTASINPNGELEFGNQVRQMLNLWGPNLYGIGVQASTMYFRVDPPIVASGGFRWYRGGSHNDADGNAGPGGFQLMYLDRSGNLFTAGAINPPSDRALKANFGDVDPGDVLARVVALPISTWQYRSDERSRHLGPTAQDFRAAFGLGGGDTTIATVDADGVALAAIQGLNAKLEAAVSAKDARIAALETRLALQVDAMTAQQREIAELRRAVDVMLTRTSPDGKLAAR
jgi:hypothetical protein